VNKDVINRVIELAIQIQQIPSPTFQEGKRAKYVEGLFLVERAIHCRRTEHVGSAGEP